MISSLRGKAYLQHLVVGCKMSIGVRVKNPYKLQVKRNPALSRKAKRAQSRELVVERK